jgi:ferredoxin
MLAPRPQIPLPLRNEQEIRMPTVAFAGQKVECPVGANLRTVLVRARLPLYNGAARALHCRGLGACGTCAVRIKGEVSEPTSVEKLRINMPPHDQEKGLRLACQCNVLGDLEVTKYTGLWGQGEGPVDGTPR